jgi:hypothetical protein
MTDENLRPQLEASLLFMCVCVCVCLRERERDKKCLGDVVPFHYH